MIESESSNLELANTYHNLADAYAHSVNIQSAIENYNKALSHYCGLKRTTSTYPLSVLKQSEHLPHTIDLLISRDKLNSRNKNVNIENHIRSLMQIDSLIYYLRRQQQTQESIYHWAKIADDFYDHAIQTFIGYGFNEEAFNLTEKSKSLNLLESQSSKKIESANQYIVDSIETIQKELFQLEKNKILSSNPDDFKNAISHQEDRLNKLIELLKSKEPHYYSENYNPYVADITTVQSNLNSDECLIEYAYDQFNLTIFYLSNDKFEIKNMPLEINLDSLIQDYNQKITSRQKIIQISNQLYRILIAPIEELLLNNVIIIPDGVLSTLSFQSLSPSDNSGMLIHNYNIRYNTCASLYNQPLSEKVDYPFQNEPRCLALAPDFGKSNSTNDILAERQILAPLNFNKLEVQNISEVIPTTLMIDTQVNINQWMIKSSNHNILHLATHAVVNYERPNFSYLAFGLEDNDRLYLKEVSLSYHQSDLVVLSACNTGNGRLNQGETVQSMVYGFAQSGIHNAVSSLWSINDASTAKIMTYMYQNIANEQSVEIALSNAQRSYLSDSPDKLQHPYYWAGMVYYGDELIFKRNQVNNKYYILGLIIVLIFIIILLKSQLD